MYDFLSVSTFPISELTLPIGREIADYLGDWMNYCLKPEALEKIHGKRNVPFNFIPSNLEKSGNCWALTVLNVSSESIVRPAVILPLRWKSDTAEHDSRLPIGLHDVANSVLKLLSPESLAQGKENTRWTIQPGLENMPDISQISSEEINWRSAWAPLYASLKLAMKGLLPNTRIFATGAWSEDGIQSVVGVSEKAKVALEWNAENFFYPENIEAKERVQLENEIPQMSDRRFFQTFGREKKPDAVLSKYIALLAKEPEATANEEVLDNYYLLQSRYKRQQFYLDRIKSRIVERIQTEVKETLEKNKNRTLVCWIGGGNELIDVAIEAFQPKKVFLLKTEEFDGKNEVFNRIQKKYTDLNITAENLITVPDNLGIQELKTRVRELFRQQLSGLPLLLDLTSGKVSMSLSLYDLEKYEEGVTDIRYLYWDTKSDESNQPIPRTTKPVVW